MHRDCDQRGPGANLAAPGLERLQSLGEPLLLNLSRSHCRHLRKSNDALLSLQAALEDDSVARVRAEVTQELVRGLPPRALRLCASLLAVQHASLLRTAACLIPPRHPPLQAESITNAEELQREVDREMRIFVARWNRQARTGYSSSPRASHRGHLSTPPSPLSLQRAPDNPLNPALPPQPPSAYFSPCVLSLRRRGGLRRMCVSS